MKIHAFTHSAGRPTNEDTFFLYNHNNKIVGTNHSELSISTDSYPLTIAVLDGVGGHELGGEAAQLIAHNVIQNPIDTHNLETVLTKANDRLCSQPHHGFTTITALQIASPDRASFISCGDSRLYLIKEQQLIQLSCDDSTAWILYHHPLYPFPETLSLPLAGNSVCCHKNPDSTPRGISRISPKLPETQSTLLFLFSSHSTSFQA